MHELVRRTGIRRFVLSGAEPVRAYDSATPSVGELSSVPHATPARFRPTEDLNERSLLRDPAMCRSSHALCSSHTRSTRRLRQPYEPSGHRADGVPTDGAPADLVHDERYEQWRNRYQFERLPHGASRHAHVDLGADPDDEPGPLFHHLAARTRFFDEITLAAVENGTQQIVIVGAGYDCRALRFRRIIAPLVLRYALPGLGNVWQLVLKESALVSVTGVVIYWMLYRM